MNVVKSDTALDGEIYALKQMLYGIIDNQKLSSEEVVEVSQKLDSLIVRYYRDIYMVAV